MKSSSGVGFPPLTIVLETPTEVYDFMVIMQHFMTPENKKLFYERGVAATTMEHWARNHYNHFKDKA